MVYQKYTIFNHSFATVKIQKWMISHRPPKSRFLKYMCLKYTYFTMFMIILFKSTNIRELLNMKESCS